MSLAPLINRRKRHEISSNCHSKPLAGADKSDQASIVKPRELVFYVARHNDDSPIKHAALTSLQGCVHEDMFKGGLCVDPHDRALIAASHHDAQTDAVPPNVTMVALVCASTSVRRVDTCRSLSTSRI